MEENFLDHLKYLIELEAVVEQRVKWRIDSIPKDRYESDETKDLAEALSKASGEFKPLRFNRESNWFAAEFTDLDNIMIMIRPILSKYGLVLYFYTEVNEQTILHTKLKHTTGQWIETRTRLIPSKDDLKTVESATNHLKRQQAMALLNITLEGDLLDDDACQEMSQIHQEAVAGSPANKIPIRDYDSKTITKEQLQELEYLLVGYPGIGEQILRGYRLQHLADMPYSKFKVASEKIRDLKEALGSLK